MRGRGRKPGGQNGFRQRSTVARPAMMSGVMGVTPRMNGIKLHTEFNIVAVNATLLNPYTYYYLNLTNPQLSGGGGATAVPFFGMYAFGYRKYRVNNYAVRLRFGNSEGFICSPFTCPFNYLPPNTVSSNTAAYQDMLAKHAMITTKGGMDSKVIQFKGSVARMAGFANRGIEDPYVGFTDGTSPPSDNIYTLVAVSTGGVASVTGVFVVVEIDFVIDFEERQTPASLKIVIDTELLKLAIAKLMDELGAMKEDKDAAFTQVYVDKEGGVKTQFEVSVKQMKETLQELKRKLWDVLGGALSWVKNSDGTKTLHKCLEYPG